MNSNDGSRPSRRTAAVGCISSASDPFERYVLRCFPALATMTRAARGASHLGLSTDVFHPPGSLRYLRHATDALRALRQRRSPHSVLRDLWTLPTHSFG